MEARATPSTTGGSGNLVSAVRTYGLVRRLLSAFIIVSIMGSAGSAAGLWFATASSSAIQAVQDSTNQLQAINALDRQWLLTVLTIDGLLQTRSPAALEEQLDRSLAEFNNQLAILASGLMESRLVEQSSLNQQAALNEQLTNLSAISSELENVIEEFKGLARSGRWGSALTLRQTRLAELQRDLDLALSILRSDLQAAAALAVQNAERSQSQARLAWVAAALIAFAISLSIGWVAGRNLADPLNQLVASMRQATRMRSAVVTLPQVSEKQRQAMLRRNDEIGELWQAFEMMVDWLKDAVEGLERNVAQRTSDLERRSRQVQAAAEVGRDITLSMQSLGSQETGPQVTRLLLAHAANLISQRFNFYQAGIFLVDQHGEFAVLAAASGPAAAQMLANQHRLKIGQTSLVGFVSETGRARIALDVGKDAVHFRNPLLPETRSEVALPLRTGQQVIGVLDVQSNEPSAFDEQDIAVLQIIADQLAAAIERGRLLAELQVRLDELERFSVGYEHQAWEQWASSKSLIGYEFDSLDLKPVYKNDLTSAESSDPTYSFPIQLRGETIGNLKIWSDAGQVIRTEEQYILEQVSERLGQILEAARLFGEAQERSARQQALSDLTARMVRALDAPGVLQAAGETLARLPVVRRAAIHVQTPKPVLRLPPEQQQDNGGATK